MIRKDCENCNKPFLQSGIHDLSKADRLCSACEEIEQFKKGKGLTHKIILEDEPPIEVEQGQLEFAV
jgi:hypothetical protein